MFSTAHSELGLRGYSVILQHLKAVHYPKTTTCVVCLNIQIDLRRPFYSKQQIPSYIQTWHMVPQELQRVAVNTAFRNRRCLGLKTCEENI